MVFHGHDGRPLERYVVNVLSVGPEGLVDRYVEKIPGLLGGRVSYGAASAWALAACPRVRLRLRLSGVPGDPPAGRAARDAGAGEVVEREVSTYLLGLCNGAVFGGGMRLAPDAVPDDGLLDVVSVACDSKWTVARHLPKVYGGRHLGVPGVEALRCRAVEVELLDEDGGRALRPRRRRRAARQAAAEGRAGARCPDHAGSRAGPRPRRPPAGAVAGR